jgi:hypothetical protein
MTYLTFMDQTRDEASDPLKTQRVEHSQHGTREVQFEPRQSVYKVTETVFCLSSNGTRTYQVNWVYEKHKNKKVCVWGGGGGGGGGGIACRFELGFDVFV